MAARLGTMALVTLFIVGCATAQVTPSPSAEPTVSPPPSASATPSPSPTPIPTPTTGPSPSLTLGPGSSLAWQRGGTIPGKNVYSSVIVGFAGGYVVLGLSTVSFSADGQKWTAVDLPFHHSKDQHGIPLEDQAESIATDGTRVVVVGGYGHIPCTPADGRVGGGPECLTSPISWVTTDGLTWRTSYPWRGPATPKPYNQGLGFSTVWAVPTGGWDAALDYVAGEAGGAGSILHSADGLTWTALPSAPSVVLKAAPSAQPPEFWGPAAADAEGRRLVAGTWYVQHGDGADSVTQLLLSADGSLWKDVASFPGTAGDIEEVIPPTPADGNAWMLAGNDAHGQPTIWTSSDFSTWSLVNLPTGAPEGTGRIDHLSVTRLGLVALGSVVDAPDADSHQATWVNLDGVHWTQLATPTGAEAGPDSAADGPAGVIGLSTGSDTDVPAVIWRLK